MSTGQMVGRPSEANLSARVVTATGSTTARSLAERAGDVVNVLDSIPQNLHAGIRAGTNTTALQAYFQAVVDALTTRGGTICVPRGVYRLEAPILWKTRVSMRGEGPGATIFKMAGVEVSAIEQLSAGLPLGDDPAAVPLEDITFADFEIDGSGLTGVVPSVGGKGIFILYMRRSRFENLYIHHTIGTGLGCDFLEDSVMDGVVANHNGRNWTGGAPAVGQSGIGIGTGWKSVENVTVSNCHANYNGNHGIFVETQNTNVRAIGARVVNSYAEGNRIGFANRGSGGTTFAGCEARANTLYGFHLSYGASNDVLSSCVAVSNGSHGFYVTDTHTGGLSITNSQARSNTGSGFIIGTASGENQITGSKATGNGAYGFYVIDSPGGATLSSCVARDNTLWGLRIASTGAAMKNVFVEGGDYSFNQRGGIDINGGTPGLEGWGIRGATIRDNGRALTAGERAGIRALGAITGGMVAENWIGNSVGVTTQSEAFSSAGTTADLHVVGNTVLRHAAGPFSISGTQSDIEIRANKGYNAVFELPRYVALTYVGNAGGSVYDLDATLSGTVYKLVVNDSNPFTFTVSNGAYGKTVGVHIKATAALTAAQPFPIANLWHAPAWAAPANGNSRLLTFFCDGTAWFQVGPAVDVQN